MCSFVLSLVEIGHDTVHDMRLWREEVYRIDIAVRRSSIGNLFDVWSKSGEAVGTKEAFEGACGGRTRDVLVQNGVLLEHIVDQASTIGIHDEYFPLRLAVR